MHTLLLLEKSFLEKLSFVVAGEAVEVLKSLQDIPRLYRRTNREVCRPTALFTASFASVSITLYRFRRYHPRMLTVLSM